MDSAVVAALMRDRPPIAATVAEADALINSRRFIWSIVQCFGPEPQVTLRAVLRTWIISAAMLKAISSGVLAPMLRPIGP